jgi:type I restriction enzyme, R subunit
VKLSHYALRNLGHAFMIVTEGQTPKLEPLTEAGSGSVQEKEKARLAAIIEKVNELFEGELTDQDRLVYVDTVIKTKLLESKTLIEQAASNTKEQFATSPDIDNELLSAVMAALDAHNTMSSQALNSDKVRAGLKDILLNYAGLWEALRAKAT